jgi:hypothetical protein
MKDSGEDKRIIPPIANPRLWESAKKPLNPYCFSGVSEPKVNREYAG